MSMDLDQIMPRSIIHRAGKWLFSIHSFLVFRSYLRLKVSGREHLPEGPFIICSNHQSHLDAIILGHVGAFYFSRSALIAAKDYWYDHRARFFWSRFFFNIIPISRKENARAFGALEVTRLTRAFIAAGGRCVVILPEGTRAAGNTIRPFKNGVVMLARNAQLPIVPVYIEKSGHYWPKGSFFIRPGSMAVRIGKPIFPEELPEANPAEVVRNCIIALSKHEA